MDLIDLVSDSGDSLSSCSSVLEVPGVNEETYILSYDPGTLNLGYCVLRDAGEQEVVEIGVINPRIPGMTADHMSAALHVICDMHRDRYPGTRLVLIEHQLTFQGVRPFKTYVDIVVKEARQSGREAYVIGIYAHGLSILSLSPLLFSLSLSLSRNTRCIRTQYHES